MAHKIRSDAAKKAQRSRLTVDDRRSQLLALALDMFAEVTYEDFSIGAFAKAAKVSKGLLYHYFPGKRALYVAALREAAKDLLSAIEAEVDHESVSDEPPTLPELLHRLELGVFAYLRFVEQRSASFVFVMRAGQGVDPEVGAIVDSTRSELRDRLLHDIHGLENPVLTVAVRGWIGFVEAASLSWLETRQVSIETLASLLVESCVSAVQSAQRFHAEASLAERAGAEPG